jgi:hypothetical protein
VTAAAFQRARAARDRLVASPGRTAAAWAGATFLALALLAGGPGISRDEAAVLERGAALHAAPAEGVRPSPPLPAHAAAATRAALSPLGISTVRSSRLATALLGALLSAALALLARHLAGTAAAFLAPALFWAAPRHLHAGLVATPDLGLAALAVATVLAWRWATTDPAAGRRRLGHFAVPALLFGAALAFRTDAWVLLPVLAADALSRALAAPGAKRGPSAVERRLRGVPPALLAMATIGPLLLAASWPALLAHGARAFGRGEALPLAQSARTVALTVPATVAVALLAGVGLALLRLVRIARGRAPAASAPDEVLLLLCAAAPFLAAAAGLAPAAPGARPWLHAMPFLAILGARALLGAAEQAWPARAAPLAASVALLVLWPGLRAAAHFYPAGSSAWNEVAGGAPGAATLGMPRQDGGEAAAAVLDDLNARARPGARVYWATSAPAAVRAYARDGRLRPDLAIATTAEEADVAVVTVDGASRDAEYRVWSAFRTARPAAGAYLDEVPLALVYARPGAWR